MMEPFCDCPVAELGDICKSFRRAYADSFDDDWEEWHRTSGNDFFGRFYGSGEGLPEFKRLAESAYLVICEVAQEHPEFRYQAFDREWGWHGWLRVLHYMAFGYPTPLLRGTLETWGQRLGDPDVCNEDHLVLIGKPENGGAPYPLHPFHWQLEHSVYTSSVAATELILDDERALLVGEGAWRFPVSYSVRSSDEATTQEHETEEDDTVSDIKRREEEQEVLAEDPSQSDAPTSAAKSVDADATVDPILKFELVS